MLSTGKQQVLPFKTNDSTPQTINNPIAEACTPSQTPAQIQEEGRAPESGSSDIIILTHEMLWAKLVKAEGDCVRDLFYPFHVLIHITCHPVFMFVGVAGGLYAAATEILVACVKDGYALGWVTGGSCIVLAVSLLTYTTILVISSDDDSDDV